MAENTDLMASRYGHTPGAQKRSRILGVSAGVVFALVLGAWLWWGGVLETPAQLQTRDLGYVQVSDSSIQVNFEVTTQPGTNVACAVQALSASYGIVGWKLVALEPATTWTRTFSETLRTSEPAVTGLLYECWLP
jgi:hypothetical protein